MYMKQIFRYKKAMFLDNEQWEIQDDLFGLDANLDQNEYDHVQFNESNSESEKALLDELSDGLENKKFFGSIGGFGFMSQRNPQQLF